ncbi:carboxypeptidase-like regulatory domain-containing protein [Stieleria varia]|nr:carboxypeptidase-like regulatory domain-containing protein [Stieleria varia]
MARNARADDADTSVKRGAGSMLLRGIVVNELGDPVAGAVLETVGYRLDAPIRITTNDRGAFVKRVPADNEYYGEPMLITGPDGQRTSFVSGYQYHPSDVKPFRIVIRPKQKTSVQVVDTDGRPVADADVRLIANHHELTHLRTDHDGTAELSYPSDAEVDWIVAHRDGKGMDYYENYDAFPSTERLQVPENITMTLQGAVDVTVKVEDSKGAPLSGIRVHPWTIHIKDKLSYVNLSGVGRFQSNNAGECKFNWFPANLLGSVTFLGHSDDYYCPGNPSYVASSPESSQLTMTMFRNSIVRGNVRYADGSPAVGIRMQGEGRGDTNHYFRDHCSTDENGNYEIKIYPDQTTILAITDQNFAAESKTDILLPEGKDIDDVDFTLSSGTLVTGVVTMGADQQPVQNQTATLIQNAAGDANLVRWNETDETGRYHFRVGPGTYTLRLVDGPSHEIVVKDEPELIVNQHLDRLPRGNLDGRVVDAAGEPVAGAVIMGESTNAPGHAGFSTTSGDEGTFATERWMDRISVHAFDIQSNQVGHQLIEPDDKNLTIELQPGGKIVGTLLKADGTPIKSRRVVLNQSPLKTFPAQNGKSIRRFAMTDEMGQYEFHAVPINVPHTLYIVSPRDENPEQLDVTIDESNVAEIKTKL